MTLIEFMRARLDGDEAVAQAAPWELDAEDWPHWIETNDQAATAAAEAYRDRFPPARVLAEVAAKRAILAECADAAEFPNYDGGRAAGLEWTVYQLAQVWADHPDFDPAWRT